MLLQKSQWQRRSVSGREGRFNTAKAYTMQVIHVEAKENVRKQIVRELHIMHDCTSPNIVTFYGAFLNNSGDVIMCMEYMDSG